MKNFFKDLARRLTLDVLIPSLELALYNFATKILGIPKEYAVF